MVRINLDQRELLARLSLAGMANDELLQVLGTMEEGEQLSFTELGPLPNGMEERIHRYLNADVRERKDVLERECIQTLVVGDEFYPERLALTPNPPVVIYAIGRLELMAKPALSVVGARKHTAYGAKMCKKFVAPLAELGLVIVSGLALGIDRLAHSETLAVGGETIAVLGNGIGTCYPKSNRALYERIRQTGLILSEYPPFTPPKPFRFPERNRIIAALGGGTLVVEAKERSGSLITARLAAEYGREVFAICGNLDSIYSRGANRLILDGAEMVLDYEDIQHHKVFELKAAKAGPDLSRLSAEERQVYESIGRGNQTTEALSNDLGWEAGAILATLTILELKDIIMGVDSQCIQHV